MNTLNDISILIVTTANSVIRLQSVYNHIRNQYPTNEIVVVYDNIQKKLLPETDSYLIQITTNYRVYVSKGYNLAIKHCTKPFFVFLHDDTYTAPDFLENIVPHLSKNSFCNFVTVEPPLFGNSNTLQKPIENFGLSSETFDKYAFDCFYWNHVNKLSHITEPSPFGGFFMAGPVSVFKSIGGFDEKFIPYFYEDSDLMVRMHLAGYKFTMILNAIVYHIGSLTSRKSADSSTSHKITEKIFLSKWKTTFDYYKQFSMLHGINYTYPSVNIQIQNCDKMLKEYLELFSDINAVNTIKVDGAKLTQNDIDLLPQIPFIIEMANSSGLYELGNLILIKK